MRRRTTRLLGFASAVLADVHQRPGSLVLISGSVSPAAVWVTARDANLHLLDLSTKGALMVGFLSEPGAGTGPG